MTGDCRIGSEMVEKGTSSHGRKGASASTQVDKQTRKASSNEQEPRNQSEMGFGKSWLCGATS